MIDLRFKEEVNHYSNEINKVSPASVCTYCHHFECWFFKKLHFASHLGLSGVIGLFDS